jgi:hypothetical protein
MVEPIITTPAAIPADFSSARRLKGEPEPRVDLDDVLTWALFNLDSEYRDFAITKGKRD